jgi:hypothetical protein
VSQPPNQPGDGHPPGGPAADRSLISDLLPTAWPPELATRLDAWQTGHLLPRPALTWAGLAGEDPITGTAAGDDDAYDWQPIADRDFVAPYGMLVSQTCDVVATGTGGKHPFVEIAPVFRRNDCDKGERRDIEQFKSMYQVALTQPPEDGFWVADLRLVMPISKALLAAYDPLPGFASSQDLLNLAEALARKRRRPALHEALSEDLPKSLDEYVKEKSKARPAAPPGWLEKVEQVRLRVTGGDRSGPPRRSFGSSSPPLWRPRRRRSGGVGMRGEHDFSRKGRSRCSARSTQRSTA